MRDEDLALVAKSLAHPARLQIVRLLAEQQECRGAELFSVLPLAQSTVSQHLAVLRTAGVVSSHAVGQGQVYCLDPEVIRTLAQSLTSLVTDVSPCSLDTKEATVR